jgi:hypothetical protein
MKLVHLHMKRPYDNVSLFDGELFMVKRGPYEEHLASALDVQHVGDLYTCTAPIAFTR